MAMKKYLLLVAVLTVMATGVVGQVPDTVYQRAENYFYMEWYDETDEFNQYDSIYTHMICLNEAGNYYAYSDDPTRSYVGKNYYTDRPIRVKGLACMIFKDSASRCTSPLGEIYDSLERLPEYMYLLERDSAPVVLYPIMDTARMKLLDSVRWDTATPKVFKLKRFVDTSYGYMYCWLYEAMFDEPVTVDGHFFIAGTFKNNACAFGPPWPHHFQRVPTIYVGVRARSRLNNSATFMNISGSLDGMWAPGMRAIYGVFNAILTGDRLIQLHTDSDSMGTVSGEGFYPDSSTQYIEALPLEHYRFVSWNDGDTTNPRAVLLTQDTSFTAYFRAAEQYRLDLESNDAEHGSVYGAGIYEEGDTAKIRAEGWRGYRFAHWSDGDTANPRWVVVTQDTSFVGIFVSQNGIGEVMDGGGLRLVPNPADGYVVVSCDEAVEGVLAVADVAGKTVRRYTMSGTNQKISTQELADGIYYVTLNTAKGSATRKLVVERR